MGLLEKALNFDVNRVAQNPAFQMGMGILGSNTGNYGEAGPAYAGGLQYMARQQALNNESIRRQQEYDLKEKLFNQKQAEYQRQLNQQKANQQWVTQNHPTLQGAPSYVQKAAIGQQYKSPSAIQEKLNLYKTDPKAYKGMFPGQQTNINMNNGRAKVLSEEEKASLNLDPNVPFVWDKQGMPKSVKQTNYSDAQSQAGGFAERMEETEARMQGLMDLGYDPSTMKQMISTDGGMLGNYISSEDAQVYTQAKEDWVRAKLRKESGAVIGPEEMADEIDIYFPKPGDKPAVVEAKAKSRAVALRGMARMSGGAYQYKEPPKSKSPKANQKEITETKRIGDIEYYKQGGVWYTK